MLALRLVMPSTGDMELIAQNGGTIDLSPIFYGSESMGPHIQLVEMEVQSGKPVFKRVVARYRIKIKDDYKIELKKGDNHESQSASISTAGKQ